MRITELIVRLYSHQAQYGDIEILGWDQQGEMRHLETTDCDGFTKGGPWYAILHFGPEDPYPGEEPEPDQDSGDTEGEYPDVSGGGVPYPTSPERVEWNPAGYDWHPATVVERRSDTHLVIRLDDNQQELLVETRHLRPATEAKGQDEGPRVWYDGDLEPNDVIAVLDRQGVQWTYSNLWIAPGNRRACWSTLVSQLGPLTEVHPVASEGATDDGPMYPTGRDSTEEQR